METRRSRRTDFDAVMKGTSFALRLERRRIRSGARRKTAERDGEDCAPTNTQLTPEAGTGGCWDGFCVGYGWRARDLGELGMGSLGMLVSHPCGSQRWARVKRKTAGAKALESWFVFWHGRGRALTFVEASLEFIFDPLKISFVFSQATGWAQWAHRLAAAGISLRHSGQGLVAGGASGAGPLNLAMSELSGRTMKK